MLLELNLSSKLESITSDESLLYLNQVALGARLASEKADYKAINEVVAQLLACFWVAAIFKKGGNVMTFYTLKYIEQNQNTNKTILYILIAIAAVAMIAFTVLYLRHRFNTRYRDLGIIALLFLLLFGGTQYEKYVQTNLVKSQSEQITPFIKSVAKDFGVPNSDVLVSSTTLQDGLIVRINSKDIDYQLELNDDNNTYSLKQAHVINHQVDIKNQEGIEMDYTQLFIKFVLGVLTLIFQINVFGKTNIAPTTALDQLQNYVLGGIIGGVIYNSSISVLQFLLVLIVWTLVVFILKFAREHSNFIRSLIDGKPIQIIKDGQVLVKNCLKAGISANELMFKLRSQGIYSVDKVKNCIFEKNGQLTVIKTDEKNVRFPLINDGQINQDVLESIDEDENWLKEEVKKAGFNDPSDIFLADFEDGHVSFTGYDRK